MRDLPAIFVAALLAALSFSTGAQAQSGPSCPPVKHGAWFSECSRAYTHVSVSPRTGGGGSLAFLVVEKDAIRLMSLLGDPGGRTEPSITIGGQRYRVEETLFLDRNPAAVPPNLIIGRSFFRSLTVPFVRDSASPLRQFIVSEPPGTLLDELAAARSLGFSHCLGGLKCADTEDLPVDGIGEAIAAARAAR